MPHFNESNIADARIGHRTVLTGVYRCQLFLCSFLHALHANHSLVLAAHVLQALTGRYKSGLTMRTLIGRFPTVRA